MREDRSFRDIVGDTIYLYLDPLRSLLRHVATQRRYRVTYHAYNGYPSLQHFTEEFTADHDREARRYARTFACGKPFELEQIRPVNST